MKQDIEVIISDEGILIFTDGYTFHPFFKEVK